MSRRGYGSDWQGSNNPNMAPLPPRPSRAGGGSSSQHASSYASASQHHHHRQHSASHEPASSSSAPTTMASENNVASPGPEVATTLFVGSISPGISDSWLTKILEACGNLRSLKRASKAFGFAEYADPDSVLRAIKVLNGRELPAMGSDARSPPKNLLVKADERTKRFLDQYEQTRINTDDDARSESDATSAVEVLVRQMSDPSAAVETDQSQQGYVVPDHLKDLPAEELPEEHRGTVLSEIEHFRQAAAARDAETRRREAEFERQRALDRKRRAGLQAASSSHSGNVKSTNDPQSYHRPINFQPGLSEAKEDDVDREPEESDEIEWQKQQESKKAAARQAAAEAERAYAARERQRLARWEKEADRERGEQVKQEREAISLLRRWEDWSDESASRKEPFYTDRRRWRQFRASARRREEEADQRDRVAEEKEEARAREETEKFLAQQAAEMAKMAEEQRAAGVLVPSEGGSLAPIKLNAAINSTAAVSAPISNGSAPKLAPAGSLLGEADEDETVKRASRLKKIQITAEMSEEERSARLIAIQQALPTETASLLQQEPRWEWVDEPLIQSKYRPWADAEIEENLGEKVEELVNVAIECLQARKPASDLVEAIEPVLAEEAAAFVEKLWRMVLVDSIAASEGIRS
ncbi:hypothetical protein BCV70DRAFT_160965 [Testicularia cyperi]|uniref:RRM domain-containing protein n=1 Tax=Testicularia cyperi TaxID=1882483 RepID=A0A317XP73_9BASI|nr:hypothetical protein BCV70DRAFT_160965 [Testicularia cyperi]